MNVWCWKNLFMRYRTGENQVNQAFGKYLRIRTVYRILPSWKFQPVYIDWGWLWLTEVKHGKTRSEINYINKYILKMILIKRYKHCFIDPCMYFWKILNYFNLHPNPFSSTCLFQWWLFIWTFLTLKHKKINKQQPAFYIKYNFISFRYLNKIWKFIVKSLPVAIECIFTEDSSAFTDFIHFIRHLACIQLPSNFNSRAYFHSKALNIALWIFYLREVFNLLWVSINLLTCNTRIDVH